MTPPVVGSSSRHEVATLTYEVADKALAGQVSQWQELRGRVTTLVTLGPAAAVVIVTTTSAKFDLLALLALISLAVAVGQSIWAVYKGRHFSYSPLLPATPVTTSTIALKLALAQVMSERLEDNHRRIKGYEGLFLTAAACFLAAVLLWSVHVAVGSRVLFVLG